jgi:chromosome segregation ATPase
MDPPDAPPGDPPPEGGEAEEEGEFPFLKADHPLLARLQKVLYEQIAGQHERAQLQLRECEEEARKLVKHREDVGVTLYGAQQQLAKLQLQLEQLHDSVAVVTRGREEADQGLIDITATYDEAKKGVDSQLKKLQKAQDELNQLEITLRQVDEYNTQMRAEIAVTRRATHKAEENIKGVEKSKVKQDLLIDKINEEIKTLTERKAIYEAQLVAQKQETEAAVSTLTEAAREMEAVEFEKKQLQQQLQSALRGMMRRDSALQNVDTAMNELEEQSLAIESEMRGLARSGRHAQEENEKLAGLLTKNENELSYMQTQMSQIHTDRQRLAERYAMLRKSLDSTTGETAKIKTALKDSQQELQTVEASIQKVARETMELNEHIEEKISQQATVVRSEANTNKSAKKLGSLVQDQEMELQNLQNEISRVMVDSLNTKAHNQMLKERLETLTKDLAEREKLIDQYELEIRKRHNQIEKKQLYVDRLNREFDEKRSKQEDDNTGPMEGKIKSLRKQIAEKTQECQDMQKSWITKQTDLLALQEEIDTTKDHVQDQKNRKLILQQKHLRTEGGWEGQKKEITDLRLDVKQLQYEMDKLNTSIASHGKKQDDLTNTNQNMETEFVRKLKDIEQNCLETENEVDTLKLEKDAMMEEIVEAERQVMLWERKIHLEKEMQEALDPSVGQAETTMMKKEIHRMELRYEQLKRRQDQMIQEMERVIHKRDAIQLKYEPKAQQDPNSGLQLKRQLTSLRSNLKLAMQSAQETENRTRQREDDLKVLQDNVVQITQETQDLERSTEEVQLEAALREVQRASLATQVGHLDREAATFEQVLQEGQGIPAARAEAIRAQVREADGMRRRLDEALNQVADAYPQLDTLFQALRDWQHSAETLVVA